ncbi:MAG TPA: tRNA (adenosine(37)-N6)-threonylcarbamoyltransferase complex dimerization subunit type 1 TsaB [Marinobacter sp.]|nr:tRNA (adenosine(37)-N6)-threonylcarbamoyltransferase complex dimerization subunit type 1 TsaB [Marinobacter sp.]
MKLLALDTSSEGCSAALWLDGRLNGRFQVAPRGHTRLLMPMVRELLAEEGLVPADLDALAFARGPGSFTGLRIATGVIQGLAWGLDIPVVPVSSLTAVALQAMDKYQLTEGARIVVAFDARMDEVYLGTYECRSGWPIPLSEERVCPPEAVGLGRSDGENWLAAGSGWAYAARMPAAVTAAVSATDESLVPRAVEVARLAEYDYRQGRAVRADQAQPVYVRDEVAWKKLPGRD